MKIAMLHQDLPGWSAGGVSSQVHVLANALARRGHQVDVHTAFEIDPSFGTQEYARREIRLPAAVRASRLLRTYSLAWFFARVDLRCYDVAHAHGDSHLMLQRPTPVVRTFYGAAIDEARTASTWRRKLVQTTIVPMEWLAGATCDRAIGISPTTVQSLPFIHTIVPCGVDIDRFAPPPGTTKSPCPSILFVGALRGRKRGHWLTSLFLERVKPLVPDAELWLVTPDKADGDGVVWLGRVGEGELVTRFREAWTFCSASTYEGFGIPYVEAMAAGTAVISTPNGGARDVLEGGHYGGLAEDADLAGALVHLLTDRTERERYAALGRERAATFSIDSVAHRYEGIYDELRASRRQASAVAP